MSPSRWAIGRTPIGKVGQTLRLTVIGHLNTPAPPAGYIAGFVVGGDLTQLGSN